MTIADWVSKAHCAIIQLNCKRKVKGHLSKQNPWTYAEYRTWFKNHYELGVKLGLHNGSNGQRNLLKQIMVGMMVPDWKSIDMLLKTDFDKNRN